MSVTKEEAIKILQHLVDDLNLCKDYQEVFTMSIAALRGPTREQVEKAWRGEWQVCFEEWQNHRVEGEQCSKCGFQNYGPSNLYNFCPKCGSPITDKAVETIMKRMEEMRND